MEHLCSKRSVAVNVSMHTSVQQRGVCLAIATRRGIGRESWGVCVSNISEPRLSERSPQLMLNSGVHGISACPASSETWFDQLQNSLLGCDGVSLKFPFAFPID